MSVAARLIKVPAPSRRVMAGAAPRADDDYDYLFKGVARPHPRMQRASIRCQGNASQLSVRTQL